ncbi:MAG: putative double-strand break repair [Rhizobium sp.]|nr:putative double-strand break repair [Rhizobium sp.]
MKLSALRLHNVKRFAGHGVAIEGIVDGVNVLTAANEYGKSTCFEALHALFFQPHSGTPNSVKLLRPYSGGNPLVEADIAVDGGRYRLTKQFYGGRRAAVTDIATGRLVAQADEAEAFIANLIRGGTSGPAGLLWVRQGMTGIENRSRSEEENDKRVRESLLSSVQGEVEALTGGRRMAEIHAACEEELYRLVTQTLKPKTGGRYAAARDDRDRLGIEEARLAKEVKMLHEALDIRRRAQARLTELEDAGEDATRKAAIEAAEAGVEAAKFHDAALREANAEAELAGRRRDEAQLALESFDAALARSTELAMRLLKAETALSTALERRSSTIAESETAAAEVQTTEQQEREGRELLVRLDAALQAREAAERLEDIRRRLEQAEALRGQIENDTVAHAMLAIPHEAIERLEALDIKIVRLRAAAEIGLPTLRMDYDDGAAGSVTIDRQPLPGGEDRGFSGIVKLDISGIGRLTIDANRQSEALDAIEKSEAARRSLLQSLGVEDLVAARRREAEARQKHGELERARERLADLAPQGIEQLRLEVARLVDVSQAPVDLEADPDAVRADLADASQRIERARNRAREAFVMRGQADEATVRAQTDHAAIRQQIEAVELILDPVAEREAGRQARAARLSSARELFGTAEARALPLRGVSRDLAGAEATLSRTRSVAEATRKETTQLREELADINGQIRTRSEDAIEESWAETRDALTTAKEVVRRFETEVSVLDRLRRVLTDKKSAASDLYLKPVMAELTPLIGLLFDDIAVTFDGDTLLPQNVRRNGQDEDVDRLSGGMREQLSVLTRLAFARLLARDGRPAPVILDDALVYSDDDRIERMFDALHRQARDQQILVFSCRQRAFARLGGNVLTMVPWAPAG